MTKNLAFSIHATCLAALFILGSAVVSLPTKNANEVTVTGFFISVILAFLLFGLMLPFCKRVFTPVFSERIGVPKKFFLGLIFFVTALFSLWCAADTFSTFAKFANSVILPDTPDFYAVAILGFLVVFFTTRRQEDTLKFFFLAFWAVLFVVVFFFFAMLPNFEWQSIAIFEVPDFKTVIAQTKPYFINPVLPTLLLPVYNSLTFKSSRCGAVFTGFIIGFVMLFACVFASVLLFGASFAGEVRYPYSAAVSTVSVGRLFSRLDGFSYFLYFICLLTKATVCLFVMNACLKNISRLFKTKNKKEKNEEG